MAEMRDAAHAEHVSNVAVRAEMQTDTMMMIAAGVLVLAIAFSSWAYARHNSLERRIERTRRRDEAYRKKRNTKRF